MGDNLSVNKIYEKVIYNIIFLWFEIANEFETFWILVVFNYIQFNGRLEGPEWKSWRLLFFAVITFCWASYGFGSQSD